MGSKKYFTLWIIWPGDKNAKNGSNNGTSNENSTNNNSNSSINATADDHDYFSEDDDDLASGAAVPKPKDLKNIIESEVHKQKYAQKKVDEQLERHKAHDQNVSLGAKVAALAIGGVVVGALTAGIGLVPYITVVGMTAVAGGGAVLVAKRPGDSRLIMACETMWDALSWKHAIEMKIRNLEPTFPSYTDPHLIMFLSEYNKSFSSQTWTRIGIMQGMRIMRQSRPMDNRTICYRAQLVVPTSPIKAFLGLMEGSCWPKKGFTKIQKVLDDHIDQLRVQVSTEQLIVGGWGGKISRVRGFNLTRFWKLDDDGTYLIAITTTSSGHESSPPPSSPAQSNDTSNSGSSSGSKNSSDDKYSIAAVLSISPRQDSSEYDEDILECLLSCTCQLTCTSWTAGEIDKFLKDFLKEHLVEFKASVIRSKYGVEDRLHLEGGSDVTNLVIGPVRDILISVGSHSGTAIAAEGFIGDESLNTSFSHARNKEESKDATLGKTEKKRFFKRSLQLFSSDKGTFSDSGSGKLSSDFSIDHHSDSKLAVTSPSYSRKFTKSRRSTVVNSEASSLRGRIASKEYELQRMERSMRAKKEKADKDRGRDTGKDIQKESQQQGLYSEQLSDLKDLKVEYEHLTGTPYDQVNRFGALKRVLKIGSTSSSSLLPTDSTSGAKEKPSSARSHLQANPSLKASSGMAQFFGPENSSTATAAINSGYPMSWQPLTLPLSRQRAGSSVDMGLNVIVFLLFAFCIVASTLMANLLSSF